MEDEHDEQDSELLVDREGQANKHAVQQHTKLQDRDADDLRRRRVLEHVAPALDVLARVGVWERLPTVVVVVVVVFAVGVDGTLLAIACERGGLLLLSVGLRAVRRMRRQPMSVCVVHEPEACESGGAPSEGDELDDENREDAEQANSQRVRLVKEVRVNSCMLTVVTDR